MAVLPSRAERLHHRSRQTRTHRPVSVERPNGRSRRARACSVALYAMLSLLTDLVELISLKVSSSEGVDRVLRLRLCGRSHINALRRDNTECDQFDVISLVDAGQEHDLY